MGDGPQLDATVLAQTLATVDQCSTIRPGALDATLASQPGALDATIAAAAADDARADLAPLRERIVLGTTIGEGGMAVVRTAKQTSLDRDVAVKTLRPDATDEAAPRMLREAWITGALEHPNIVPVHDLGSDDQGRPMIVLKRIEGRPWSELIGKHGEIRARFGMDALEWNLQQLVHVCHAIAFAHNRGIVHRDLKPANIMIGGFGEVYVLDWGIAVSLLEDHRGRLPLASQCREVAGTLAYMAPEMLGTAPITERTDVYLLGAILYEIATGAPPHLRESVSATIDSIQRSTVVVSSDVPDELAAICRRALAKQPRDRFASADELRTAIVGFLEHRGSATMAREAQDQLDSLEQHLAAPRADETPTSVDDAARRVRTYQLFGQARFGFQAALRAWSGNTAARTGLERALEVMARYELDQGDPRAAAVLIAELTAPAADLIEKLAEAERIAAEKVQRLSWLEADRDASRSSGARTWFIVVLGLAWALSPLTASFLPAIHVSHALSLVFLTISLTGVIVAGVVAREALSRTSWNRGVYATVLAALVIHGITEGMAWRMGLDEGTTNMISCAQWAGCCAIAAVFIDRAVIIAMFGFLVAFAAIYYWPAQRLWALSAGTGVLLTVILYVVAIRGRKIAGIADMLRRDAPS